MTHSLNDPNHVQAHNDDEAALAAELIARAAGDAASVATAASDATTKANAAQAAAISTASTDATTKSAAAQAAAIAAAATDATTKANTAQSAATTAAASDATSKVAAEVTARNAAIAAASATSVSVATFDAAGDLLVGTGNDVYAKLTKGTALQQLRVNAAGTALEYADPAATGASTLTPTATKTATYTVAVGEIAMMNVAGGAAILNLPAAPADKAQVAYRAIGATTAVPLVINRGGSDTIGIAGATSASIPLADEVAVLQYQASSTRWLAVSNVKTQASLDARYQAAGSSALTVQDENSNVSTSVTQMDFQGAGVTVTAGSGEVVVAIPGNGTYRGPWTATTAYILGDIFLDLVGSRRSVTTAYTSGSTYGTADLTNTVGVTTPRLVTIENADIWAFGHSYVSGTGGGSFVKRFANRHLPASYTDRSAAGATAGATATQVKGVSFANDGTTNQALFGTQAVMAFINNANGNHTAATVAESFRSIFAQLTCTRWPITATPFAFGTGWTSGVTTTTGSYFDYAFSGDTSYLLMNFTIASTVLTISNSGTSGAIARTVDIGGYSEAFPGVLKLSGYGAGFHTVRVTLSTGAGATVYFGLVPNPTPGTILHAREGSLPTIQYSVGFNTNLTVTYPAAVDTILADFPTVVTVSVDSQWDPNSMTVADNTHLNTKGTIYWANLLEKAMSTLDLRQGQNILTTGSAPAYLPRPIAGYSATAVPNTSTSYTNLKASVGTPDRYVYSISGTELPTTTPLGSGLVITGGSGWTPGSYLIDSIFSNTNVDGTHTWYHLSNNGPAPTTNLNPGGVGRLST